MALYRPDEIEAIGVERITGKVVLTLADESDWSDEHSHLTALQAKLNAYIRFIEGGELLSSYPDSVGRSAVITVLVREPVPPSATQFFQRVLAALEPSGIGLRIQHLSSSGG